MPKSSTTNSVVPFPKEPERKPSSTEKIWGKSILKHGYTAVPSILIKAQKRIGINSTQMNIIIQLLDYWIEPTRKPFPTKKAIAERIGITPKTVQINIRALEQAGLIRREMRKTASGDWNSNIYHLDGLIQRVQALEPDFAEAKKKRTEASQEVETPKGLRKA